MVLDARELDNSEYTVYDIRTEEERDLGTIPGSVPADPERRISAPPADKSARYVLVDGRGDRSPEIVKKLREMGYDASGLRDGYFGFVKYDMEKTADSDICRRVEESIQKKFRRSLMTRFTRALTDYRLIDPGDRIAVCISGGKDSMCMAKLFQELHRYTNVDFDVRFVVMDPGYNADNRHMIEENARRLNVPIEIFESPIFDSVYGVEKSPCYLCARMRRGYLYRYAKDLGCNKIALGHHYDDVIETILMGMLHGAQIQTMMPKLHSTNFEGMELIRPMYLIREEDIKAWRDYNGLHFIQCACRFTESVSFEERHHEDSKRKETKRLIKKLKETNPDVDKMIFKSVENVNLDTVIAYKKDGVRHSFLDEY